ncbi:MAG TPA: OmpA family protein [Anaerohalosphaeraceae bacterium]|nr:OmpA family protein [Anaerohalosphaeraceae bacterium]
MKTTGKMMFVLVGLVAATMLTGCTDWKKKYEALDVEYQNVKGLYENCEATLTSSASEKGRLERDLADSRRQLEDMQKQIATKQATPAQATGFEGVGEVAVDADAGTITVTISDAILFASGSATLKNTYISELDKAYSVLRSKYAGRKIDIVGHTDTDPISKTKNKWQDNWELSAERALTVVRYLVKKGIPDEDIRAAGCGASRPVAANSTAAGKAKNRRVEIVVYMR